MDQVKSAASGVKTFWTNQPRKRKGLIAGVGAGVLALALVITLAMNINASQYSVLFSGITAAEASEVYAVLQDQGVSARMNGSGQVTVPSNEIEGLIFQMASKGYPRTAPPYGTFFDNVDMTTTEFEKRKADLFQLQERVQTTLMAVDGVKRAIVTITIPESSGLVIEANVGEPTAAVMLTLDGTSTLAPEAVATMKRLVAASVANCKAENIVVSDASTGIEFDGGASGTMAYSLQQFDYERRLSKRAEDAIKNLFSPTYTADGMRVSASFEVDTEKMKKESKQFVPEEDGNGVKESEEEHYISNGKLPVGGIAGEEENTDPPPDYVADANGTQDNIQSYDRITKFETSYVIEQIESGTAPIKKSSITLLVNDKNLTAAKMDEMAAQASRATGIDITNISVGALTLPEPGAGKPVGGQLPFYQSTVFIAGLGAIMLVLAMLVIVLPVMLSRKKKKRARADAALAAEQRLSEESAQRAQAEIDMHKNKLRYEAEAQKIQDGSMTEEIRSFAKENPEMTATLIRSLLKEDG